MNIARVLTRTTIGALFVGHGTQKLFGWFGGGGVDATADMFEHLGLHPGRRNAMASGIAETTGGALLAAGFATPLAAATVTGSMLTAIRRVHLPNGPWINNGGYEYNLVLIAAVLALAEDGPGRPSLDAALGVERRGTGWALAALAGGAAGALVTHRLAEREAARARVSDAPVPAARASQPPIANPVDTDSANGEVAGDPTHAAT